MIAISLIDQCAGTFRRAHKAMQGQMKGLLGEALDRLDGHSPAARRWLLESLHTLRMRTSVELMPPDEGGLLRTAVSDVLEQAIADAGAPLSETAYLALQPLADESTDAALSRIRDTLRMDEAAVLAAPRKIQLRAGMRAAAGVNPIVAFNMEKGGALRAIQFTRPDRLGRRWDTTVFSTTVLRGLLVSLYCETFMLSLVGQGVTHAAVVDHDGNKIPFDIVEDFEGLQEHYFHPNAERLVTHL
jgi:hypothetical protein